MNPDDLTNAEELIDVWEPVGENPCLASMTIPAMTAEGVELRKALAQAEHRASMANRDYYAAKAEADRWKAKFYALESRGIL